MMRTIKTKLIGKPGTRNARVRAIASTGETGIVFQRDSGDLHGSALHRHAAWSLIEGNGWEGIPVEVGSDSSDNYLFIVINERELTELNNVWETYSHGGDR